MRGSDLAEDFRLLPPLPVVWLEHHTLFVGRTHAPLDGSIHGVEEEGEHVRVLVLDATKAINMCFIWGS